MIGYNLIDKAGRYEKDGNQQWWTNILLDNAYDLVKDHKFPILIPSYNNPNPSAVNGFLSAMTAEYNYPIILFVRDSQKDMYEKANKHPYVTIVSMEDNLIDDAGKARRWSLKWLYTQGYTHAFSFDDDACGLGLTERGYTGKGDPKSAAIKNLDNIAKVLAAWQLSMETLEESYNNVILTGAYPVGFSWKEEYCDCTQSALLYRGNLNQVVCLNVKNLIENGITYESNKISGHEDIDLILQGLQKDMMVATFPFIWYSTPPMDIANFSCFGNNMEARFKTQQGIMRNKWGDYDYISYKEKRGLSQVTINFRKYRNDKGISDYLIDIWNNGRMIHKDEASN